jgi:PPP family 3-phenylpropionic acid transporter
MGGAAIRMALFFAVSVAMLGVFIPFWPAWLESRGLSKVEIGHLVAAWAWARGVAGPVFAHFVDRSGARRAWILGLSLASTAAFAPFGLASDFWPLFAITVAFGALHAQVIPLGENMILFEARRQGFSYAGVRWFGSLAFLVVSVLTGRLLEGGAAWRAFPLALAFLTLTCLAAWTLPRKEKPAHQDAAAREPRAAAPRAPLRELLSRRPLLFVLTGVGVIQSAHATYYAYSTLHWSAAGHTTTAIGWLWAEGVVAEIVLFAAFGGGRLRWSERKLLALAVLASLVRWSALAATAELEWLLATQWLHAFTFAAAHLAAMTYLSRSVGVELSATAQSVYSSVNIAAHALTVALVAPLFAARGGAAFWPMLPIALLGGALAWYGMSRRSPGETAARA